MEYSTLLLVVCNFILIGLLPRIFFKRGKLTLMWLVTAWPYLAGPVVSSLAYSKIVPLWGIISPETILILHLLVVPLSILSIGIIFMTIGTHRVPLALWHQNPSDDAPQSIVTWGTYRYIRHPFYTAFILAGLSNLMLVPCWINLALFAYICLILNMTAAREENRLSHDSGFGVEYQEYKANTSRFIPVIW